MSKDNASGVMTGEYVSKERMISYYNQSRIIKGLGRQVKNILEIGIRNSLLSDLLTSSGYNVTTADVNPELKPDLVLDLTTGFEIPKDKFDAIVLFQVLEHIPYSDAEKALKKLAETTRKFVVISLPYETVYFTLRTKFSFTPVPRNALIQVPKFWISKPFGEEHEWEMGLKEYPKKRLLNSIQAAGFSIRREFQDALNPYHYFFVLEKMPQPAS